MWSDFVGMANRPASHAHSTARNMNSFSESQRDSGSKPRVASRELSLRLPLKIVMAHGSRIPREHYDFHHVAKTGVASPQTLKTRNSVTLAIEVSAQFGDDDHSFAKGAFVRVFFLASSPSTSHSMGLNSTSHGSSGTSRPKRASNMIRQAITASMAMARSNTSAR